LLAHNWVDAAERRNFFDNLANQLNFDPSDAESWYLVTLSHVDKAVCFKSERERGRERREKREKSESEQPS
jgi:hypothetical protein